MFRCPFRSNLLIKIKKMPKLTKIETKVLEYLKSVSDECYDNGCNIISESNFEKVAKQVCEIVINNKNNE